MSMMMSICRKTKNGLSNPLPVMGLREEASGQHWWASTGCPRDYTGSRQGHTNSAARCKPSSKTHAAGCYCCRLALRSRRQPCSTLSRRFTTDLKDPDPLNFTTGDRIQRRCRSEVRDAKIGYSDEPAGSCVQCRDFATL